MSTSVSRSLSPAIKALVRAPHAHGNPLPAPHPEQLSSLLLRIASQGKERGDINHETWLTLSTGALVTINSPATLCGTYSFAVEAKGSRTEDQHVKIAAIIREAALKSISFSGIPRTINALAAFRAHLPPQVSDRLATVPIRELNTENLDETHRRGRLLWDDIYQPHSAKLLQRLNASHPDLPVHILSSHYAHLLSDPDSTPQPGGYSLGRVLTSVLAISCLRAQTGVAPQVTSHIHGLQKALLDEEIRRGETDLPGQDWLTSDEGMVWILESVDSLSQMVTSSAQKNDV